MIPLIARTVAVAVLLSFGTAGAAESMKGTTYIVPRAGLLMPLYNGDQFSVYGREYQPFLAGWNFGIDAKRAFWNHTTLGITLNVASMYDDSTGRDNRGDKLSEEDNAGAKLSGVFFGAQIEYYYDKVWIFRPYVLGGMGLDFRSVEAVSGGNSYSSTDLNAKLGTGLFIPLSRSVALDLQGKVTFELANLSADLPEGFYGSGDWSDYDNRPFHGYFEPTVGLVVGFGGGADADGDGVGDASDNCPATPAGAKVDAAGCPIDTDGDGVYDGLDKCPATPKGAKVDQSGCPTDSDNDGVFDGLDKCPDTPAGMKVDNDGCPPDSDRDGVSDDKDRCPNTPSGATVDASGCPVDSDKDGVYDGLDRCPNTPTGESVDLRGCPFDADYDGVPDSVDKCLGTPRGVKVDSTGCPIAKKITEKITLNINYETNGFEADAKSKRQLDDVAERLIAYPETRVEIRGFTDDRNTEAYNLELSQKRADGVRAYLVSKGVSPAQMVARGYGEDPAYFVAPNSTAEGRRKNRRTEIEQLP